MSLLVVYVQCRSYLIVARKEVTAALFGEKTTLLLEATAAEAVGVVGVDMETAGLVSGPPAD